MQTEQFENWLRNIACHSKDTIRSRVSNCKRLERDEGDLDGHFDRDRMEGLLARLVYSIADEHSDAPPRHNVTINGDVRKGTATLKGAATLYKKFRENGGKPQEPLNSNPPRRDARRSRISPKDWPKWDQPKDEDILQLAKVLTPLVKFLHPDIVAVVAEDNRRHSPEWRTKFEEIGVDPDMYLWRDSPCAFPGVRRYAGSHEVAWYRKRTASTDFTPPNCLLLDDNDCPKHVWAFVFTGKPFRKKGPPGYRLAHLADHKEHNNRWPQEFGLDSGAKPPPLFGLYTSPANTAYVPENFLKPTDFVDTLRMLLLSKAYHLYSGICRLAPPPLVEKKAQGDSAWNPKQFEWSDPVGETDNLPRFLEYRQEVLDKAFKERLAENKKRH